MTSVYGPFLPRDIALMRGTKRYYINQPCKQGHNSPRYSKTRNCCQCDLDRKKINTALPAAATTLNPSELALKLRVSRLDIVNFSRLALQGFYVYCYLRSSDLTPYYIGIGSTRTRAYSSQHNVNPPADRRLIRIMRRGLSSWQEACLLEQFYIRRYGRKDIGTGVLRNRTDGGEGTPGRKVNSDTKAKISTTYAIRYSTKSAERHRIPFNDYMAMSTPDRNKAKSWMARHPNASWQNYCQLRKAGLIRIGSNRPIGLANNHMIRSSFKYVHRGLDVETYQAMSRKQRNAAVTWLKHHTHLNFDNYKPRAT